MKKSFILTLLMAATLSFSFAEDGVIGSILENKNSAIREIKSFFSGSKTEIKEVKLEKVEIKQEDPEVKSEIKASTTNNFVCENKSKLFVKRDKINTQIKNQIKDKNKLTDQLLEISSGISTSSKELIDEKIIKLDTEVGNAIKIQKSILNIVASSTDSVCIKESKESFALNKSIKKLELDTEKQLEKINNIIKKDIKNLLVEINSTESN